MMRTHRSTAELGEVVATAFDEAARYSTDPRKIAEIATAAVGRLLRRSHQRVMARRSSVHLGREARANLWPMCD